VLLLTALRNRPSLDNEFNHASLVRDVSDARDAWHDALLERGMMPFLMDALDSGQ
jgi:hypothetical protein